MDTPYDSGEGGKVHGTQYSVLLFIGKLNTAFPVILAIPTDLSASPILYRFAGFSFNLVSLPALIIAIGIVVDEFFVMTTLTVLVISFPLILGRGQGSEYGQRMGIVMLGGIVFSAVLTFFVVPAAFNLFERKRAEKAEREAGVAQGGDDPAMV